MNRTPIPCKIVPSVSQPGRVSIRAIDDHSVRGPLTDSGYEPGDAVVIVTQAYLAALRQALQPFADYAQNVDALGGHPFRDATTILTISKLGGPAIGDCRRAKAALEAVKPKRPECPKCGGHLDDDSPFPCDCPEVTPCKT